MLIDGEELTFKCRECGREFKHIIGYGPVAPNPRMREKSLKEHPPVCPKCGSKNVKRYGFFDRLFG